MTKTARATTDAISRSAGRPACASRRASSRFPRLALILADSA